MGKQKLTQSRLAHHQKPGIQEKSIEKKHNQEESLANLYNQYKRGICLLLYKGTPFPDMAAFRLEELQKIGLLEHYLKDTKYDVFQWGLQHNSLKLIIKLIALASLDCVFSMIENNDYYAIKQFVNELLKLNIDADKELLSTKCAILKKIIDVSPRDVYRHVIAEIVEENNARNPPIVFPQAFQEIIIELEKKLERKKLGIMLFPSESGFFPQPVEKDKKKAMPSTQDTQCSESENFSAQNKTNESSGILQMSNS